MIEAHDDLGLLLVDRGSTNGTFVNKERVVGSIVIKDGDILNFGTAELRVSRRDPESEPTGQRKTVPRETLSTMLTADRLPVHFEPRQRDFLIMLAERRLRVAWQPIVDAQSRDLVAYEVLGRGGHAGLPESPIGLFSIAERLEKEVELSQAFRETGALAARGRGAVRLFMNSHPKEIRLESFYDAIEVIRTLAPNVDLVIEVNEDTKDPIAMREMAARLHAMGVGFAYDDFGAGLSRLRELADIPADVVKFDMGLIRDIDSAGPQRQRLLSRLVTMVSELGSTTLAEGVETEAEAAVCLQMGFDQFQGYLTGRPQIVGDDG
jgi:EAL domain-containing protein (putative c-di-GMP-specific phosphodiesterase class I)